MLTLLLSAVAGFELFRFIEGDWCARALGGEVIERWEAPFGDAMTGSMTLQRDGAVVFHEFFALTRKDGRWQIRLKHFHPDISSWEEKNEAVVFPLVEATDSVLTFEGLNMTRLDDGAGLEVRVATDAATPLVFSYRRCDTR